MGGVNYQLRQSDFPFHVVSDPLDRNSAIEFTTNDVASSQGTFGGTFHDFQGRSGRESCDLQTDPTFQLNGKLARRVEPRNTPTMINAIFQFRTFWDGRANNRFNGVDPSGRRNADAKILVNNGSGAVLETLDMNNAALASQAVGPPGSDLEMACARRAFKLIGRKLLHVIQRPLFGQKVASNDSVLGPFAHPGHGLKAGVTYETLIKEAFQDKYWNALNFVSPAGFTMMEENFSMYWGLAIMLYQSTLVSDETPFDKFVGGRGLPPDVTALSQEQKNGMALFTGKGKCSNCHKGPDFTGAGVRLQAEFQEGGIVERMEMAANGVALYDNGFYNIGVTPTNHDLGVGEKDDFGNPLSFTRQFKRKLAGQNVPDPFQVNTCSFEADPCIPQNQLGPNHRDAVDGAFKTPGLRNVELTGPYMHNGGMATLEQVIEFYNRGGNRRGPDGDDTTGFNNNLSNLDPDITRLELTDTEKAELVAFLKALTDDRVRCEKAPFDHPALANFNGHSEQGSNEGGKLNELKDVIIQVPASGANGRPAGSCLKPFHEGVPQ